MKTMMKMKVPPEVAVIFEKHSGNATKAINQFLKNCDCKNDDEVLGALGALSFILVATGDTIQARMLAKTPNGLKN